MNHTEFVRRLTLLNARIPTVEFVARRDEDSTAEKAAKAAAVAAGTAGLVGGGLYLRGRAGAGAGAPRVGIFETMKGGAGLIPGDIRSAYEGAKAGVRTGYGQVGAKFQSTAQTARRVASNIVTAPGQVRSEINSAVAKVSNALQKARRRVVLPK